MIKVTFKNRRSGRVWEAYFDLGSEEENGLAALGVAWKHDAEILPNG